MKKMIICIFAVLASVLSCSNPVAGPDPTPSAPSAHKVIFLGDGQLSDAGLVTCRDGVPVSGDGLFATLAEAMGVKDVRVTNFCYADAGYFDGRKQGGKDGISSSEYGLYQLLNSKHPVYYSSSKGDMDEIYDQDVVFMQQRAGAGADIVSQAVQLSALFPPTCVRAVMNSAADIKSGAADSNKLLRDEHGWKFVPWGDLINDMYSSESATFRNYVTALMACCIAFDLKAQGAPTSLAPGEDKTKLAAAQKEIDAYIAEYCNLKKYIPEDRNVLKGKRVMTDSYVPTSFPAHNGVSNMVDGSKSYNSGSASTYADFKWTSSAANGRDYLNQPHYNVHGVQTPEPDSKYLCSFKIDLEDSYLVDSLTFYNSRSMMDIDGFDILLSDDGNTWNPVYSGEKLASGCRYEIADATTNCICVKFPECRARYLFFGLTAPRCQDATDEEIAAFNAKYGTPASGSGPNANPHFFRIVEMELFTSETPGGSVVKPDPDPDPKPRTGKKVMFAGNSQTYYGEVIVSPGGYPSQDEGVFEKVAKSHGIKDLTVTNFCYGAAGYTDGRSKASEDGLPDTYSNYGLYQLLTVLHPDYYGKGGTMDDIYDQDYVVLQQRGSDIAATYDQARQLMSLFPPTTKFCVMTTHYDYKNSNVYNANKKLHDQDGVTVIPWGDLISIVWDNQIYGMGYTYKKSDFIITKDNTHPNYLTGYITALMTYCAIYGGSAVGADYSFVKSSLGSYYTDATQTQFPQVLADAAEMERFQKLIDGFLAGKSISDMHFAAPPVSEDENVLKDIKLVSADHFSPAWSVKTTSSMTDGVKAYGNGSNYADFKWASSAAAARTPSLHYDATGAEAADGKYLCGFTLDLGQTVKVDSLTFFNQRTLMDIDGFDILVSTDNSSWTVVYSGEKLASGCRYEIFDQYTNYISAKFAATDARYVRFALTAPRCQTATADEIAAFNAKYGTPPSGSGANANPHYFRIVELEMFRAK